jgi:DNA invertase Pin-like site-specific DNA recombinase
MLTLLALERYLNEKNVELHTVEGHIDTSTPDGWSIFAMRAFMGEMERRQVKYRTKRAVEYKRRQGAVVGAIPYGFRRNGNGLEVDCGEQSVILLVNDLYQTSYTLTSICRALRERDITTRNGRAFTPQQVKRLIAGYENAFSRSDLKLSRHLRQFITAIA